MALTSTVVYCCLQGVISGIHMVQCFHKAGLPAGLINVITGRGAEIGDYLCQHPSVNCISFTGGDTGTSSIARLSSGCRALMSAE